MKREAQKAMKMHHSPGESNFQPLLGVTCDHPGRSWRTLHQVYCHLPNIPRQGDRTLHIKQIPCSCPLAVSASQTQQAKMNYHISNLGVGGMGGALLNPAAAPLARSPRRCCRQKYFNRLFERSSREIPNLAQNTECFW